jgi:hypothetical protein
VHPVLYTLNKVYFLDKKKKRKGGKGGKRRKKERKEGKGREKEGKA